MWVGGNAYLRCLHAVTGGFTGSGALVVGNSTSYGAVEGAAFTTSVGGEGGDEDSGVGWAFLVGLLALGELGLYAGICLAVQLALSHAHAFRRLAGSLRCLTKPRLAGWQGRLTLVQGRIRLAALQLGRHFGPRKRYKAIPTEEADV